MSNVEHAWVLESMLDSEAENSGAVSVVEFVQALEMGVLVDFLLVNRRDNRR